MEGDEIQKKLQKKIEQEKKKLSKIENSLNEEAAIALDGVFSSEPEGIKAEEATCTTWGKSVGVDGLKKSEWEPSKNLQKKMMKAIKYESESEYYNQLEDPEIKSSSRKLASFTLSFDAINNIDKFSKKRRMNKSRFIEMLIDQYEAKEKELDELSTSIHNSAGPTNLNLLELANRVAKIIETNNLIKTS